jgi:hypothetical protein
MLIEMAHIGTKGTHLNGGGNVKLLIPVAGVTRRYSTVSNCAGPTPASAT